VLCLSLFMFGCAFTIESLPPLKPKPKTIYHGRVIKKKSSNNASTWSTVDSQWMSEYHRLEKEHGNYIIRDDSKIRSVGGQFRVPRSVIEHYQDLNRTIESPTPTP